MKKVVVICLTLVILLAFTACGEKKSGSEKSKNGKAIELSFSSAANENSTWHKGCEMFAKEIEDKTNGKYKVKIYTMDQLSGGNQATGIELLQQGSTDIHLTDALVWSSIQPKAILPAMPWLLPTYDEADKYMEGEGGKALLDAISESGVKALAIGESGYRQIVNTKRAITKVEDMNGLKIRVPGSNAHVSLMKALGADPVTMSSTEVYTATQQGTIDGSENTIDLLLSQKTLEVSKYLTLWNYSYDPIFLSVSNKLWESLSDEEKDIFQEAADKAMKYQKKVNREEAEKSLSQIEKEYPDVKITKTIKVGDLKIFKEKAKSVYDENKDAIGADLFKKFGYDF